MAKFPIAALLALAAFSAQALDLQAHRGGRGLLPENTLPAFDNAMTLGVDTLELDIGVTADGVVVISHDPYLNPAITRDAQGQWLAARGPLIRSLRLAELQTYDVGRINPDNAYAKTFATQQPRDGTRVPSLASLFDLVKRRNSPVRFNIETKIDPGKPQDTVDAEAMVRALLKVVNDAGMKSRVTVQSFDWRTLALSRQLEPAIPTVYLTIQTKDNDNTRDPQWTAGLKADEHGGNAPRMVKAAGGAVWSPNQGAVTEPLVKEAQSLGLKLVPWTVNDPAMMDKLIGWGVDGLITDYPDRLREVMAKRGLPLPAPVR